MGPIHMIFVFLGTLFRRQAGLAAENLALREQLAVLEHKSKRPRLRKCDRIFWAILSRVWSNWRSALLIVQPDTVIRWHRQGFKLFWRWKSRVPCIASFSTNDTYGAFSASTSTITTNRGLIYH